MPHKSFIRMLEQNRRGLHWLSKIAIEIASWSLASTGPYFGSSSVVPVRRMLEVAVEVLHLRTCNRNTDLRITQLRTEFVSEFGYSIPIDEASVIDVERFNRIVDVVRLVIRINDPARSNPTEQILIQEIENLLYQLVEFPARYDEDDWGNLDPDMEDRISMRLWDYFRWRKLPTGALAPQSLLLEGDFGNGIQTITAEGWIALPLRTFTLKNPLAGTVTCLSTLNQDGTTQHTYPIHRGWMVNNDGSIFLPQLQG